MIMHIMITILLVVYILANLSSLAKEKNMDGVHCIGYFIALFTLTGAIGCIWF